MGMESSPIAGWQQHQSETRADAIKQLGELGISEEQIKGASLSAGTDDVWTFKIPDKNGKEIVLSAQRTSPKYGDFDRLTVNGTSVGYAVDSGQKSKVLNTLRHFKSLLANQVSTYEAEKRLTQEREEMLSPQSEEEVERGYDQRKDIKQHQVTADLKGLFG